MSSQSDPGKQAQKERRGTSNRLVRPLALGFNAQMSTNFFKGDFKLPALHKPFSNLEGSISQGCTQYGDRVVFAERVADQHPSE